MEMDSFFRSDIYNCVAAFRICKTFLRMSIFTAIVGIYAATASIEPVSQAFRSRDRHDSASPWGNLGFKVT